MATDSTQSANDVLTTLENSILDIIQCDFPISSQPYAEIAQRIGSTEAEVLQTINNLRQRKIIRRIGGSFDAKKMGYLSVLVAARVAPDRIESVAEKVNSFTEVTHNYQRAGNYNLWFTVIAENDQRLSDILESVRNCAGVVQVQALPALRTFKIRVKFNFTEDSAHA